MAQNQDSVVRALKSGAIGVIGTDTVYGIVGSVFSRKAIERIYEAKERDFDKPFVILIADLDDLDFFGIKPSLQEKEILEKIWPGKVSVILPCLDERLAYLHRGKKSLAFRLPAPEELRLFLNQTGPLASSSANLQGLPIAKDILEAHQYFRNKMDFYVDQGEMVSSPSTIVLLQDGQMRILRQGDAKVD